MHHKYVALVQQPREDPYTEHYEYTTFKSTIAQIQNKAYAFHSMHTLDLAGQRLGDEKAIEIIDLLKECPVKILSLGDNNLTDDAMFRLSFVLPSLKNLRDLLLPNNRFTDMGVRAICEDRAFAPSIRTLNLSRNPLGPISAYYIGRLFRSETQGQLHLENLFLGGRVGRQGWGNDFMRVLGYFLCSYGARQVRTLSIPEAGLDNAGLCAIAAVLSCNSAITSLNIVKNKFSSDPREEWSKRAFRAALLSNRTLDCMQLGQCGLSDFEKKQFDYSMRAHLVPSWIDATVLTFFVGREYNYCREAIRELETKSLNIYSRFAPAKWPELEIEPISSFNALEPHLGVAPVPGTVVNTAKYSDMLAAHINYLETQEEQCQTIAESLNDDDRSKLGLESIAIAR
jgi:hypothetical protein